ncbi:MAG: tRNA (N6-isopentenyl adenosine(37)-C2)-methylthiotransferase MiaB [bacterium]|nr:tRNA (N6-isopentenyl adenosine(37)-C2)-methylthiotransferase MiaB [bacterium]
MRTFLIETWGCQMNQHDSEQLTGHLLKAGLRPAGESESPDLILLNTCSVREKPVQKILSRIGELAGRKPQPTIGVCGCVAQQEGKKLLERSPAVGFVLGPGQNSNVGSALHSLRQGERSVLTDFDSELEVNYRTIFRKSPTRGMITIIEGCDEFCTFCIVPYTRGRERSRPFQEILNEVRHIVSSGLHEVELLGQTINNYQCPETGKGLSALLESVAQVPGLERIRFITSHPRYFDDQLIDVLSRHTNVSRYLHLPLQAGSDPVLRRMRRRYTRSEYLDLIGKIRGAVPDINLSTDIIVGFPGETEDDFESTLEILEEIRFGQVFAFAYSPRPGTPAAKYDEVVPQAVQKERLQRLFAVTNRISHELNQLQIGREVKVLIDGPSRRRDSDWQGRADDNRVVNFPKAGDLDVGDLVTVKVLRAGAHSLSGKFQRQLSNLRLPILENSSL